MPALALNKNTTLEYLTYLASYADDLASKDVVEQEDLFFLNNEVDRFISRLKDSDTCEDIVSFLIKIKINVSETNETRAKSLLYYLFVFVFFGWLLLLFFSKERARNDSMLRKKLLRQFKKETIRIASMIDDFNFNA